MITSESNIATDQYCEISCQDFATHYSEVALIRYNAFPRDPSCKGTSLMNFMRQQGTDMLSEYDQPLMNRVVAHICSSPPIQDKIFAGDVGYQFCLLQKEKSGCPK